MQFIQACRQSEKNKNFVYGYAYVWAKIQDFVEENLFHVPQESQELSTVID